MATPKPERKLVRDLMTVGVFTCPPETPVRDIARLLLEKGIEEIVVLEEGHNVGTVGLEQLVQAYTRLGPPEMSPTEPTTWETLTAEQVMRHGIEQVPPELPLEAAAQLMRDRGVRALYLTHHAGGVEYPAAMLSYRHLLRHIAARDSAEMDDLGNTASRQGPLETFIQRREQARAAHKAKPK